ncbi:nucleoporin Nup37 [Harmonia axyridis]|uniref:nucleoporin Nup37 n=1 Tax=Harmonia axyridis TaxID=115357 RepID=UPI001E274FB2|nr:nucleoporin Nup37 [Harmonia axyridis]
MEISLDIVDNLKKTYTKPLYTKDLSEHGQITCIELSQFELSQDVVLIGFGNKILLGYFKFTDNVELEIISEFPIPCRCTCLSISPETSLSAVPNSLSFCGAGTDFKIRHIKTDLENESFCKILSGHTSYINDVKFDLDDKYLASVGDDNTLRIWELESYKCTTLHLNFAGVAVQWHKDDPSKLLIADKVGVIRLYNTETLKPILSFDSGKLLSSCHWSPSNNQDIASLQLGELSVWDITTPSTPIITSLVFTEAGGYLKFSPQGDLIAALNPLEGTLKVFKTRLLELKFSTFISLATNFCWHYKYPLICVGDDSKFCIWKVNTL